MSVCSYNNNNNNNNNMYNAARLCVRESYTNNYYNAIIITRNIVNIELHLRDVPHKNNITRCVLIAL